MRKSFSNYLPRGGGLCSALLSDVRKTKQDNTTNGERLLFSEAKECDGDLEEEKAKANRRGG